MQTSPVPLSPPRKTPARRLLVLTAVVLLVHGLLLGGLPSTLGLFANQTEPAPPGPVVASFVTRSIAPAPLPAPAPVLPPTPSRARAKADTAPAARQSSPPAAVAQATEMAGANPAAPAGIAVDTQAPAAPLAAKPGPGAADNNSPEMTEAAPAPLPASPPPAPEQLSAQVVFPEPVRLLYDGKGEERGFIKYAASSELLWLQDGAQYSARMEISAWGLRVRTWTSKGTLTAAGLAPVRFGDKPRGAELATHFQRDKGIISFSANNPDVPLQAGAQDKLSFMLQLSALVAGAPERYSAGNSIRFQAADAHNAEVWDFRVGGLEALELPGGPKQALKLSKAPTKEFDQSIDIWLAPDMHYLPVRLRITEANGAFADLLWRKTQNSE